jgi:hypothetical protein
MANSPLCETNRNVFMRGINFFKNREGIDNIQYDCDKKNLE